MPNGSSIQRLAAAPALWVAVALVALQGWLPALHFVVAHGDGCAGHGVAPAAAVHAHAGCHHHHGHSHAHHPQEQDEGQEQGEEDTPTPHDHDHDCPVCRMLVASGQRLLTGQAAEAALAAAPRGGLVLCAGAQTPRAAADVRLLPARGPPPLNV